MKNKKDKQFYIERAIDDFRTLIIYYNITRPQREKNYQEGGRFSLKKFQNQMQFLRDWSKQSSIYKRKLAKVYAAYSKTFNLTFGIPYELIEKVLGCYRDENGKKHRISVEEVVQPLIDRGDIREINAGRKVDYKTHKVKCYWTKKYLLKNEKQWFALLQDFRYGDIFNLPRASDRVKDIISKFIQSKKKQVETIETSETIETIETIEAQNVPSSNDASSNDAVDVRKFPDYDKFNRYISNGCISAQTTEEDLEGDDWKGVSWNDFSTVKVMLNMLRNHKFQRK